MKYIYIVTSALLSSVSAMAQTEASDSIAAQELQEIVIEAPRVVRKADMDVYHPSKSAVDNSKNGWTIPDSDMAVRTMCSTS